MSTQPDFEELLRLLAEREVDYMVVGGYAVAFHGYPRFTKDLDLFYLDTPANIERLRAALVEFGFEADSLPESLFTTKGNIVAFGVPPVRVDLLNQIDGVTFEQARPNVVVGHYGEAVVKFIGRRDLLLNKQATPRARDKVEKRGTGPNGPVLSSKRTVQSFVCSGVSKYI